MSSIKKEAKKKLRNQGRWLMKFGNSKFWLLLLILSMGTGVFARDVSPAEFDEWKKTHTNLVILDVRTRDEYKSGFIEGATNIDFYAKDFKERLVALDRNKTYLVYCRSGHRSGETVKILAEQGFAQINNLAGGLLKWNAEKRPLVAK